MKNPFLAKLFVNVILAVVLIGFGFGINMTYQAYKGTGLSRLPQSPTADRTSYVAALGTGQANAFVNVANRAHGSDSNTAKTSANVTTGNVTDELKLYPSVQKGMRTPFDLWRYYGRGTSSFASPILPMRFDQWLEFHRKQKPQLIVW